MINIDVYCTGTCMSPIVVRVLLDLARQTNIVPTACIFLVEVKDTNVKTSMTRTSAHLVPPVRHLLMDPPLPVNV